MHTATTSIAAIPKQITRSVSVAMAGGVSSKERDLFPFWRADAKHTAIKAARRQDHALKPHMIVGEEAQADHVSTSVLRSAVEWIAESEWFAADAADTARAEADRRADAAGDADYGYWYNARTGTYHPPVGAAAPYRPEYHALLGGGATAEVYSDPTTGSTHIVVKAPSRSEDAWGWDRVVGTITRESGGFEWHVLQVLFNAADYTFDVPLMEGSPEGLARLLVVLDRLDQ